MQIISAISDLRDALRKPRMDGRSVGVVPTMGALHDGHVSLLNAARGQCDVVVMTLFVNPSQFNDAADFAKYPRDTQRDAAIAMSTGTAYLFAPEAHEIYPPQFGTAVTVPGLVDILEGASRPGHFQGVATVVTKLLNIVAADRAYFGSKDYQQLQVIRRLAADLNIPTEIIACPTVREPDGLAMSSRNVRLTGKQRIAARVLSQALFAARASVLNGETDAARVAAQMAQTIHDEPLADLDYAVVADPRTLAPLTALDLEHGAVALVAAKFGDIRLIDNIDLFA